MKKLTKSFVETVSQYLINVINGKKIHFPLTKREDVKKVLENLYSRGLTKKELIEKIETTKHFNNRFEQAESKTSPKKKKYL